MVRPKIYLLLPPVFLRSSKRLLIYPRFCLRTYRCRQGYRCFKDAYPQKIVFIAGLPKSGTTWLEMMLSSYPGFRRFLIPDVTSYELRTGGSHDYELPDDMFTRFNNMLALTKMHVHGSKHNARLLREAGVKYVIMYRDLRDVAVSHYHYVRRTPWHPEHPTYKNLDLEHGLEHFAHTLLPEFAEWIRSWHENREPTMSIVVTYENMLTNTVDTVKRIAEHFELDSREETIRMIVQTNSFRRLSRGRNRGKTDNKSFYRCGTSGTWRKSFTSQITKLYKEIIGDFLIKFGYEKDKSW